MKSAILLLFILGACYAASDYVAASNAQYSADPLFPTIRDYGVNYILDRALAAGKIAIKDFQVNKINHVYIKTTSTYLYYKFDLSLTNAKKDVISAVFTVQYRLKNKSMSMASQSYSIKYGSPNKNNTGGNTGGTTGSSGYVLVPATEYTSELIQSLAEFGKNYVVTGAVASGKIPAGEYNVTAIYTVEKQTLADGANYKFDIDCEKSDGKRAVEATFTVNYKSATGKKAIKAHKFAVLPFTTS